MKIIKNNIVINHISTGEVSSLGIILTNKADSLLELLKSAVKVDMEKSKEWFKTMWEKIFGEKKS